MGPRPGKRFQTPDHHARERGLFLGSRTHSGQARAECQTHRCYQGREKPVEGVLQCASHGVCPRRVTARLGRKNNGGDGGGWQGKACKCPASSYVWFDSALSVPVGSPAEAGGVSAQLSRWTEKAPQSQLRPALLPASILTALTLSLGWGRRPHSSFWCSSLCHRVCTLFSPC